MRTIIDIPKEDLEKLDKAALEHKVSRAEMVRRSVSLYLHQEERLVENFKKAFGAWDNAEFDSSDFQHEMRKEW